MPGVDIKKDDMVQVLQGKDRGKRRPRGRVLPSEGRVMVDGVALAKKPHALERQALDAAASSSSRAASSTPRCSSTSRTSRSCAESCGKATRASATGWRAT